MPLLLFFIGCQYIESNEKTALLNEQGLSGTYNQIKSLEGEWEGYFEWTGAMKGTGYVKARYTLNGQESAVIENLLDEKGNITMTSVYHMDGLSSLRMTHFCMHNQPRLKATSFTNNAVEFDFVDITNKESERGHVYGAGLNFLSNDSLHIVFKYRKGDELSEELVALKRTETTVEANPE
ncbi:MAG: hypothetical protein AAFX87_09355 [Bacteroidota bacterium]